MKHSYSPFGEKTDATLARKGHKRSIIFVNTLQFDNTTVPLSDCQKPQHSPHQHTVHGEPIRQTSKSCSGELHQSNLQILLLPALLNQCCPEVSLHKATVKLVTSLILSHLNYCNSLLSGLPASSAHSLHHIQNCHFTVLLTLY